MPIGSSVRLGVLLLFPIAICLALLVLSESEFQRALLVAALVLFEVMRSSLNLARAAKTTGRQN